MWNIKLKQEDGTIKIYEARLSSKEKQKVLSEKYYLLKQSYTLNSK